MTGPNLTTLETYFRLMNTNGAAQVYHAALQAGMLQTLQDGRKSARAVAETCGTHERATVLLLETLHALGVLEQDGADYKLAEVAGMLLNSEYRELGNQYWRHLPTYLKTGVPLKNMDDVAESETHYQAQAATLGWMLSPAAEVAARVLDVGNSRRNLSILDVGAGSGIWSLTIARHDRQTRVTAIDWPAVLEVTKETAENFGILDRLTTIPGNLHEVPIPDTAYDLAIVANVTHLQTPEQNTAIFDRLHGSLKPNGELMIVDAFRGSSQGDVPLTLYHLGLALRTRGGRVYSPRELHEMLGDRFHRPTITPLDVPPHMVGMLVAKKR